MRTNAFESIQNFLKNGGVFEGRRDKVLAIAAVALLGAVAFMPADNPNAEPTPYQKMLAERQAEAKNFHTDVEILIVDRSASPTVESMRIGLQTSSGTNVGADLIASGGAFSKLTSVDGRDFCLVAGGDPSATAAQILSVDGFIPTNPGKVTDIEALTWQIDQQVARCFPGMDSAKASVYATYRAVAANPDGELPDLMAASTELSAMNGHIRFAIPSALRHAHDLLDEPAFAATVLDAAPSELLALAGANYGPVQNEAARQVSQAYGYALGTKEGFFIPTADGFVITDNVQTYLASATAIPEVSRMLELQQYLNGQPGHRVLPGSFVYDPIASRAEIARLAAAGDQVARTLAGSYGDHTSYMLKPIQTDEYLPASADIDGTPINFDRKIPTFVKFERYGKSIELVDDQLQPVISATSDGVVTIHAHREVSENTDLRTASL